MKQLRKPPPYCQGFVDRLGKARWYFRKPGFSRIPLPGLPWSPEFMAAYEDAKVGERAKVGKSKTIPGTISAVIASYYESPDYKGLSTSTRGTYRNMLERVRADHGDKRIAKLERKHIKRMMGDKAETPEAANNILRTFRLIIRQAIEMGLRRDDPTTGVKKLRTNSKGFTTWEEEHIAQFLAFHKPGTRAHLAFSLLLHTGQRRADIVRLGRQHMRNGMIVLTQQKTGADVAIPIHSDLASAIADAPNGNLTFITTAQGKGLTPESFTNWFRDCVKEAGLPEKLSPHGLRKAICRRLAEAGCTSHEIMAISGHKTLAEVDRYTKAANREKLAQSAMRALGGTRTRT